MWAAKYTREVIKEGRRVRWPKGDDFWPTFAVVIIISIFAALVLFLEDNAAKILLDAVSNVFKGFGK